MKRKDRKITEKQQFKNNFYKVTEEQKKIIEISKNIKEKNSPYFYGGMTAPSTAPAGTSGF